MTLRVVVCDGEPHVIRAISLKFTRAGFEVLGAQDATTGLELLHRTHPSLLITDFTLPGMSGADLVRRVRQDADLVDLPVIMLTARGLELSETDELDDLDLSALMMKPFSPRELVVKAYEILGFDSVPSTSAYRDSFSSI